MLLVFYPFDWRLNCLILYKVPFAAVDPSIKWTKKILCVFSLSNYIVIAFRILGFLIYYKAQPPTLMGTSTEDGRDFRGSDLALA